RVTTAACLFVALLTPAALAARPADTNALHARGAAARVPADADRTQATLGLPPGSNQLTLDDGSYEFATRVTGPQGQTGAPAVFLNCFMPTADQLPVTIDTVSILFPTSDQYGDTGLFPQQTFQVLVYVDPDSTGDPRNAELVRRVTFDLEPSN